MVKGYKRRRGAAGITAAEPKRVSGGGAVPPRSRVKLCVCRFVESGDVRPYSAERSDADLYIYTGARRMVRGYTESIAKVISMSCKIKVSILKSCIDDLLFGDLLFKVKHPKQEEIFCMFLTNIFFCYILTLSLRPITI